MNSLPRKWNRVLVAVMAVALAIWIFRLIMVVQTGRINREQDRVWKEIQAEYAQYCQNLPDKLTKSFPLNDNATVSVSERHTSTSLKSGGRLWFLYADITVDIYNSSIFTNADNEAGYLFMTSVAKSVKSAAYSARKDYYYLNMPQNELEKLANQNMSFPVNVHVIVHADTDYSLWDSVDAVYSGNKKIYDPNENVIGEDTGNSVHIHMPYGSMTFNEMMTDPDDYDDPDDFAEDAWGMDFEDYDEAYDYWEDW